jgi:RNA polymerase sigma factor (sigma-70 family)
MAFNRQAHTPGSSTLPPVLPMEQHYRATLASFPQLTREQERVLVQRARAGENVRDDLILSLQRRVYALAGRYHARAQQRKESTIERADLAQAATVAMFRAFNRALAFDDPITYLLRVASGAMSTYLSGRSDLIKSYEDQKRATVLSLDRPFYNDGASLAEIMPVETILPPQRGVAPALYQAIESLPEKQRFIITRYFGLSGQPASLRAIGNLYFQQLRPCSVHYHKKRALQTLRQRLTPLLPLLMGGGASC